MTNSWLLPAPTLFLTYISQANPVNQWTSTVGKPQKEAKKMRYTEPWSPGTSVQLGRGSHQGCCASRNRRPGPAHTSQSWRRRWDWRGGCGHPIPSCGHPIPSCWAFLTTGDLRKDDDAFYRCERLNGAHPCVSIWTSEDMRLRAAYLEL